MEQSNQTALWLTEVAASLSFAVREVKRHQTDEPLEWRWLCVGLVKALHASLVAALSGYETARPEDIRNPSAQQADAIAPIPLLLRRARATDYLNSPERLTLTGQQARSVETLLAYRNASLHTSPTLAAQPEPSDALTALDIIAHTTEIHPAFDPAPHTLHLALIADHLRALRAAFMPRD